MNKEKQIDEIAKLICTYPQCICYNSIGECANTECQIVDKAEALYNAGYRRQNEGKWKYPPYAPFGGSYEMKRCSVCEYKPDFDSDNPYTKYCPNCGAKMKGGEQ